MGKLEGFLLGTTIFMMAILGLFFIVADMATITNVTITDDSFTEVNNLTQTLFSDPNNNDSLASHTETLSGIAIDGGPKNQSLDEATSDISTNVITKSLSAITLMPRIFTIPFTLMNNVRQALGIPTFLWVGFNIMLALFLVIAIISAFQRWQI